MVLTGQRNDAGRLLLLLTVLTCSMMDMAGSRKYGNPPLQVTMAVTAVVVACIWLVLWARGGLLVVLTSGTAVLSVSNLGTYPGPALATLAMLAAASVFWTRWLLNRHMLYRRGVTKS